MGVPRERVESEDAVERQGFAVLPGLIAAARVGRLLADLERALTRAGPFALTSRGLVYGVRNLVDVWPPALAVAQEAAKHAVTRAVLGGSFGLVRAIYFDKPPTRTWSLPWHRDTTIAVRDAGPAGPGFGRPTVKAGVPHVGAPPSLLSRMLTARVALDDVTDENGPLLVIPASHRDRRIDDLPSGRTLAARARPVHMCAGDVLLIRPLVVHRSGPSQPGTRRHRRTLHFEFAPAAALPAGLEWHRFLMLVP